MNELRSVQHDVEILGSRIDGVEALRDMHEGHEALSTRVNSVEECVSVHHVREFMQRIILIEEKDWGQWRVIGDTLSECYVRLDQCTAGLMDLDNDYRMRAQDWHRDLSEHESSEENQPTTDGRSRRRRAAPKRRLAAQARVPLRELEPWFAELRQDTQTQGLMMIQPIRESLGFWQNARDEKQIVEAPLSRDLISSEMSPSKVP